MNFHNEFEINNGIVFIKITHGDEAWLAESNYREDYYKELSTHIWSIRNGYPTNKALGGGLHRYIMRKWYGKETVDDFISRGYIIDHMNNVHTDCKISNLEFLYKDYNTAKGQQLDKDINKISEHIALRIFKDFNTGCYQITIGCNDAIACHFQGKERFIQAFKLLYDTRSVEEDYPIVLNDAESLILGYLRDEAAGFGNFQKTHACDVRIHLAPDIQISKEEAEKPFIQKDGHLLMVMGSNLHNHKIVSIHPDLNWYPPETKSSYIPLHYCEIKNF